jgi:hypothetical protein
MLDTKHRNTAIGSVPRFPGVLCALRALPAQQSTRSLRCNAAANVPSRWQVGLFDRRCCASRSQSSDIYTE